MRWVPVQGWGRYEVSDTGLVRSADMVVRAKGDARAVRCGRVLTPVLKRNGYLAVTLTAGGARRQECVHRLVAQAFLGAPPLRTPQVLHCDGDKTNNRANNLRWGTPADNAEDTQKHGRQRRGESHPQSKLSVEDVMVIRRSPSTASVLAKLFGISREHVWAVRSGRVWK
jgi:hypothetical protein